MQFHLEALRPALLCVLLLAGPALATPPDPAETRQLLAKLTHDDYAVRRAATQRLIAAGTTLQPQLAEALESADDPELRRRLRYILENITPPEAGVLVLRTDADSALRPGDLITHVDGRPTPTRSEWWRHFNAVDGRAEVRVYRDDGPRAVRTEAALAVQSVCEYRTPRGARIQAAVRDYADGYAERAAETLRALPTDIPEDELPAALRARIEFTVGRGSAALALLGQRAELVQPALVGRLGNVWSTPSYLDLAGPGRAPYQLEWNLWRQRDGFGLSDGDPDLRVQRVLVPARRYVAALTRSAELWHADYREVIDPRYSVGGLRERGERITQAGNMLAVVSWMCHELDLRSECLRLIEPRSTILRQPPAGVNKWVRVETDAWLPLLAGEPATAFDRFYPDARSILAHPLKPHDTAVLTQNPQVAAQIALFAYLQPEDPRVDELLSVVNHPTQSALTAYARWMCFAAGPENHERIRRDLGSLLPNIPAADLPLAARALARLEYVQDRPASDTFASLVELAQKTPDNDARAELVAEIETLALLSEGDLSAARDRLADVGPRVGVDALRNTLEFRVSSTAGRAGGALDRPLIAVRTSAPQPGWIVLTRARQLVRVADDAARAVALPAPADGWFPGPLTWPWLGCDPNGAHAWAYDRRRVIEINPPAARTALRVNIRTDDIAAFDRYVRPVWEAFAAAARARGAQPGESGAFHADDIRAYAQFVADPNLPEIGWLAPVIGEPRIAHLGFRGGPDLLIDAETARAHSNADLAQQLGLSRPPRLIARGVPDQRDPLLYLMTNLGLMRCEPRADAVRRIALPGDEPHPALIPETLPYARRDGRWVYVARLPEDGGALYRVEVATDKATPLETSNLALPPEHFALQDRAALRAHVDRALEEVNLPPLTQFIDEAAARVARWNPAP